MYLLKTAFRCTAIVLMSSVLWADNLAQAQLVEPIAPPAPVGPAPAPGTLQVMDGRYVSSLTTNTTFGIPEGDPRRQSSENQSTIIEGCAARNQCPYSVTVDAIFMTMDTPVNQAVAIDENTGTVLMTTSSTDFDLETGARIRFNYQIEEDTAWEARYFGIYDLQSRAAVFGSDNITTPGTFGASTTDWNDADSMSAYYRIRLQSLEFNVATAIENTPMSCFLGLRVIRLDERYILTAGNDGRASAYDIHALNDMYGVHAGAHGYSCWGAWNFLGTTSFGIYSNQSRQTTFATDNNQTDILRNFFHKRIGIGYSAELSFEAIRTLRNNMFLHLGYDVLWVGNVARAPDQLDFTSNAASGSRVLWRDGALAHGPSIGLEARW